jgi:hypothetical protein
MKNKRGQFYLIAAILIITVIVGFVTIQNYSRKKSSVTLYDLGEELGIEIQNVMDYGTYNDENLDTLFAEFIETYIDYVGVNKNIYFLFGNSESMNVKAYEELTEVSMNDNLKTDAGKIIIAIDDVEYQFDLAAENNFYFVISQEIAGEKHVITG